MAVNSYQGDLILIWHNICCTCFCQTPQSLRSNYFPHVLISRRRSRLFPLPRHSLSSSKDTPVRFGKARVFPFNGREMNNSASRAEQCARPVSILTVSCIRPHAPANSSLCSLTAGLPEIESKSQATTNTPVFPAGY